MTERTVKLTDQEVRALAELEAALTVNMSDLSGRYPAVDEESLEAVRATMRREIVDFHLDVAARYVWGRDSLDDLIARCRGGDLSNVTGEGDE